jgi:hypothetical protein
MGAYESAPWLKPGNFSKLLPSNGSTDRALSLTISWNASTDAVSYEYCYYTTNSTDCDAPWTSTNTNTSVGLSGLTANTTYHWQVRAINADGTMDANGGTWWTFTTLLPDAPSAFNKSAPVNGTTDQPLNPTLSWDASTAATSYEYCYYTTDITNCDEPWILTTTNTSIGLSGLAPNTTYHWQVRAVNAGGTTNANSGTWWTFTTIPNAPAAFSKSAPANGATDQPLDPTLSWDSSSGAASYEYCYYITESSDCNEPWTLTTTNTSVGLSGLAPNTTYHWQVRAVNTGGTTHADTDTWWSFTTTAPPPTTLYLPLVIR